ncbi:uncharacterized protein LOC142538742 [Primulina tabacum]|uniref:uncharacterized protein LOC142538742 n=1 Tax=Primulina tabacum TaxID=48773 RepID=UPI003F59FA8F
MACIPHRHNQNPRGVNQNENKNPQSPPRVNLSREDMMTIATIVAATLQGMVNPIANAIQPSPEPQPRGIKYYYESLRKNRVPTFDGNPDPEVSHNWLKNVEAQLHLLEVPEGLRVEFVTPFLEDRAQKCWETVSPSLSEEEQITWQTFRREILNQYYPAEFLLQKLSEFENFKQTLGLTVMKYTSRFIDLGTYVPTVMSDETMKMHRFKKGLNSRIQSILAVFRPRNFAEFDGCCKVSHRIKDCPDNKDKGAGPIKQNENKTNARVYAITQEEADNTNEVVGRSFAKKLKLEHETHSEPLRVATPASNSIETHKIYQNYKISISKQIFEAELIQLNMIEFDIILGMDWLAKHHTIVDCQKKNVRIQTPTKEEVIYHGKSEERKSLLSASQAWKAIKEGEEIYLAMINVVKEEDAPKMEDIPVIQEFPDVFPDNLPDTIPNREVEFEINLVPGAAPISKAPYRMAPPELKELKEKL